MIPFQVQFAPGASLFEQTVYAVKKAMLTGQLRAGDAFPSVRVLSRELKINPNTAHKVVTALIAEGLLVPHPGIGTVVAQPPVVSGPRRAALLGRQVEELIVESKRLGLGLGELQTSIARQWSQLSERSPGGGQGSSGVPGKAKE